MIEPTQLPKAQGDADALLYDYFKHMTSLSLVSLGGALSISQLPDTELKPFSLAMVVVMLGATGVSGFAGMDEIVNSRLKGAGVSRRLWLYRKICSATLGMGVGAFLFVFFNALY
jgi:hypothetical protein